MQLEDFSVRWIEDPVTYYDETLFLRFLVINYFRGESSIIDAWQDPKYTSECIRHSD